MKKIVFLAVFMLTFSCNNQEKKDIPEEPATKVEIKKPEKFIIEMSFTLDKADKFRLFANGIFINNNRTMNISLTEEVGSSQGTKILKFDLPEDVQPDYEVGINLGSKEIKKIEIQQVKLSYGNVEIIASPETLTDHFYLNNYIDYSNETGTMQTKEVNNKHNPIMYLKKKTVDQLNQ